MKLFIDKLKTTFIGLKYLRDFMMEWMMRRS